MAEEFLSDNGFERDAGSGDQREREPVRVTICGSRGGMTRIIYQLYSLGFAQIHEWSKPQRHPQTGDLFCVLTKYLPPS